MRHNGPFINLAPKVTYSRKYNYRYFAATLLQKGSTFEARNVIFVNFFALNYIYSCLQLQHTIVLSNTQNYNYSSLIF